MHFYSPLNPLYSTVLGLNFLSTWIGLLAYQPGLDDDAKQPPEYVIIRLKAYSERQKFIQIAAQQYLARPLPLRPGEFVVVLIASSLARLCLPYASCQSHFRRLMGLSIRTSTRICSINTRTHGKIYKYGKEIPLSCSLFVQPDASSAK